MLIWLRIGHQSKWIEKLLKEVIQKDVSFFFCGILPAVNILTAVNKDTNKADSYIDSSLSGRPVDSVSGLSSKMVEQVPHLIPRKYNRWNLS